MGTRVTGPCCPASVERAGLPGLIRDLQRLTEDQDSADVVFLLGVHEERVYAHKTILMARCKSFQNTKRGEICRIPGSTVSPTAPGSPTPIRLQHTLPETFRQFIQYVYTGKLFMQDSGVFEMMTLAADLGVEDLRAACEDHVTSTLSFANACTFLAAAMDMHEKPGGKSASSFMERCISYIGENALECVKTNSFLNLPKEALVKLISSDYLCLEEEEVWRCVLSWSKQRSGVTQPTAHWTEEERARVCQHLAPLMAHVRLLLIDSKVFAEEVEPTGAVPMELSLERYRRAALHGAGAAAPRALVPRVAPVQPHINTTQHTSHNAQLPQIPHSDKRLQPRLSLNLFPGSVILQHDKSPLQMVLNNWYGVPKQSWRLLYRASTHGYSAAAFHSHCDGIAPLMVIVLGSRGEVCGGFSDVAWHASSHKGGYIPSDRAFLFALHGTPAEPPVHFPVVKKPYAICYHSNCGPIFGAGADLLISSDCASNTESYSNLPHSYGGDRAAPNALMPHYNFAVPDYEVYTLAHASTPSHPAHVAHPTHVTVDRY